MINAAKVQIYNACILNCGIKPDTDLDFGYVIAFYSTGLGYLTCAKAFILHLIIEVDQ